MDLDLETHREGGRVKKKAKIEVTLLQAKECLGKDLILGFRSPEP